MKDLKENYDKTTQDISTVEMVMDQNAELARQQTKVLNNLKYCKAITTSGPYKAVQDVPLKSNRLSIAQVLLKAAAADCKRRNDEAMMAFTYHMNTAQEAKRAKLELEKMQVLYKSEMDALKKD